MADDGEPQPAGGQAVEEEAEEADVGPMPPPPGADDGEEEEADVGPAPPKAKKRKVGWAGLWGGREGLRAGLLPLRVLCCRWCRLPCPGTRAAV